MLHPFFIEQPEGDFPKYQAEGLHSLPSHGSRNKALLLHAGRAGDPGRRLAQLFLQLSFSPILTSTPPPAALPHQPCDRHPSPVSQSPFPLAFCLTQHHPLPLDHLLCFRALPKGSFLPSPLPYLPQLLLHSACQAVCTAMTFHKHSSHYSHEGETTSTSFAGVSPGPSTGQDNTLQVLNTYWLHRSKPSQAKASFLQVCHNQTLILDVPTL